MTFARFTVAYWCVLVAAVLPIACAWLAKHQGFGKPRSQGGYDNNAPREWLARQEGWKGAPTPAQPPVRALLSLASVIIAPSRRAADALTPRATVLLCDH